MREYKGHEVRSFYLHVETKDKVQIWVESLDSEPKWMVSVWQHLPDNKKDKRDDLYCSIENLETTLDEAYSLGISWG